MIPSQKNEDSQGTNGHSSTKEEASSKGMKTMMMIHTVAPHSSSTHEKDGLQQLSPEFLFRRSAYSRDSFKTTTTSPPSTTSPTSTSQILNPSTPFFFPSYGTSLQEMQQQQQQYHHHDEAFSYHAPAFSREESHLPRVKNLFGVPTPRFCSYIVKGVHEVYTTIGPNICGWNLLHNKSVEEVEQLTFEQVQQFSEGVSHKRFLNFCAHENLITIMQQNPQYQDVVVSVCYAGELKVWLFDHTFSPFNGNMDENGNPFKCIGVMDRIPHSHRCQCGFWSMDGTKFLVCSEGYGGRLSVFNFDPETYTLTLIDQMVGYYPMASFITPENNPENRLFILSVEQIKQKKECGVSVNLFEVIASNSVTRVHSLVLNTSGPLCTTMQVNPSGNLVAFALQDRNIRIFRVSEQFYIEECCNFTAIGRGTIFMMLINKANQLSLHNCEKKTIDTYQIVTSRKDKYEATLISQHSLNSSAISLYFFMWINSSMIWTYIDSEFSLVKVKNDPSISSIQAGKRMSFLRFHDLTCCGIDFSPDGEYMVTGDFLGQVMLWKTDSTSHEPLMTCVVPGSIRAICCKWHENCWTNFDEDPTMIRRILSVFIGSLDKNVHCWNISLDTLETIDDPFNNIKFSLTSDIVCLRWCNGICPRLLACGSSNGMLCVMEDNARESPILKIKLAIIGHKPIFHNTDSRFGSISQYSEIWSVCFSPCNKYVVTCSEDQTTRIFDLLGNQIHSLTGHTTAVTSVEWKYIKGIGEVICTCADDRSVMIWRLNTQYADKDKHYHHYHQLYELEKQQRKMDTEFDDDDFDKQERHSMDRWGLYHVFRTDHYGLDWHTLTYLQIEPKGHRLAACTQNGFVFVWDLRLRKLLSFGKAHQGSCEGLRWNEDRNLLATCSSDCTINIFDMNHP
nr:unnamed protein product [Naegleria fowleri]